MKAIITTYTRINEGFLLRNNFIESILEYDLKEFLMKYLEDIEELNYQNNAIKNSIYKRGYSSILEAEKEDVIYHIRFVK